MSFSILQTAPSAPLSQGIQDLSTLKMKIEEISNLVQSQLKEISAAPLTEMANVIGWQIVGIAAEYNNTAIWSWFYGIETGSVLKKFEEELKTLQDDNARICLERITQVRAWAIATKATYVAQLDPFVRLIYRQ